MDLILIDWTRMGKGYCLAGAVFQAGACRIVRPLLYRPGPVTTRTLAWSPFLMDGHSRWEVFEMAHPRPAEHPLAPHREDVWVSRLTPRRLTAGPEQRRAILQATLVPPGLPLFGAKLQGTASGAYLDPGQGERSLVSAEVTSEVRFTAYWREGAAQPDFRARLPLPELGACILPVKDHFLLCQAERHSDDTDERIRYLNAAVARMGPRLVVRLGLSRAYAAAEGQPGRCWLMANGFFSADDPQA